VKIVIDVPAIRVVSATDYKGNPVIALDLFGDFFLYRNPPRDLPEEEWDRFAENDTATIHSLFGCMLADLLLEKHPFLAEEGGWQKQSPTGREVSYHSPADTQLYG